MTLNDIPLDYLVGWAKAHKATHSDLSYLRTLAGKLDPLAGKTWGDILPNLPSSKHLSTLCGALDRYRDDIVHDYKEKNARVILPRNASQYAGFYERVRAFISEYRKEMEHSLSNPKATHTESLRNRIHTFRETFEYSPLHCDPTGRGVIAEQIGTTRQRVDQYIEELAADCRSCLSGTRVLRVVADPVLVTEFEAFREKVGKMVSVDAFTNASGIDIRDGRTREFLVSLLDMRETENAGVVIPVITTKGMLGNYIKQIGKIIGYFRKEVIGIRTEIELKGLLNKVTDTELRDALFSLILNSEEFVKYDDSGDVAVTLRWDHLLTIPARICWILYEEKAFDYKSAIHETDLVKKYNVCAKRFGAEKITPKQLPAKSQAGDCWKIMTCGKTKYWKIRSSKNENYDFNAFIRRYLRQKGASATFDDFLAVIKSDGQYRFYKNEKSIRSRYISNGG